MNPKPILPDPAPQPKAVTGKFYGQLRRKNIACSDASTVTLHVPAAQVGCGVTSFHTVDERSVDDSSPHPWPSSVHEMTTCPAGACRTDRQVVIGSAGTKAQVYSEVLPSGEVAVAVMAEMSGPTGDWNEKTVSKLALPSPSVVRDNEPMKYC